MLSNFSRQSDPPPIPVTIDNEVKYKILKIVNLKTNHR